ncbi:hypothetical protein TNCV_1262311 [Trichonephila clavipes]|nr:hypothetical protein TNCV_1262311 [Trichonephila clavipes]
MNVACRIQDFVIHTIVQLGRHLSHCSCKGLAFNEKLFQVSKRKRILTQEEILQLMNKSDSELNDLSDDDYVADTKYESRILEGESSSDQRDEQKHGNI